MKSFFKKYFKLIIIFLILLVIGSIGAVIFFFFMNENSLTVEERNWIDESDGAVLNINVVDNVNILGKDGEGVFYDLLDDFSTEFNLEINPITFDKGENVSGTSLITKNILGENDLVVYEDHYVLIGKSGEVINEYRDMENKTIGVIASDKGYISDNVPVDNIVYTEYPSSTELFTAYGTEVSYMILPLNEYLDSILKNNYDILYHLSDVNYYYVIESEDILGDVLSKYYNDTWEESMYSSYKENEFNVFVNALNISESQIASLNGEIYKYGFVENSPYEKIAAGDFGGISAVLLSEFSDFSKVEFNFTKYDNYERLISSIENNEIDLYFNDYNYNSTALETESGFELEYAIVAEKENDIVIKSINSLQYKTVYVEANSKLYDFVSKISNVNVKTYNDDKELFDLNNENVLILMDLNTFDYYKNNKLDNYSLRYENYSDLLINYSVTSNDTLYRLLDKYIDTNDLERLTYRGINNHDEVVKSGNLIGMLARYTIILVIIIIVIVIVLVKKTKKIQIAKKIKKDDKMKFIDQLTSLKNRNYLNECTEKWDNNTIYPQAIILVDLNDIQKLNDQFGYNEGDNQIKAFANVLIKLQLDNSEIMRTDGNEFVIYLIGYSQKQVTNYIHKLSKEAAKLPHDNGAKFGYSMILDNLKTIEDCLNEAAIDMKDKKKNDKDKD